VASATAATIHHDGRFRWRLVNWRGVREAADIRCLTTVGELHADQKNVVGDLSAPSAKVGTWAWTE
jgi:hypothetical protein